MNVNLMITTKATIYVAKLLKMRIQTALSYDLEKQNKCKNNCLITSYSLMEKDPEMKLLSNI